MSRSAINAAREAPWHCLGMGLSVLCLLHCLALPWLLAGLPFTVLAALPESLRDKEWVHAALIAPVLLVSGPVLLGGRPGVAQSLLVIAAFVALIGALFVVGEGVEEALTVVGTLLLLAAHWRRLRKAHRH